MAAQTAAEISELIAKAKSAHQAFEFALGKADPDWATWYATYMLENGLQTTETLLAVANLLLLADETYQQTGRPGEWKQFFAQFLSEAL